MNLMKKILFHAIYCYHNDQARNIMSQETIVIDNLTLSCVMVSNNNELIEFIYCNNTQKKKQSL